MSKKTNQLDWDDFLANYNRVLNRHKKKFNIGGNTENKVTSVKNNIVLDPYAFQAGITGTAVTDRPIGPDDILIGGDITSEKYMRPDGTTYTHVHDNPGSARMPTTTPHTADISDLKAAQTRYHLDHPLETMQRNSEMMSQKYGNDWRDNSPYGMNPDMNTFNAVTGGTLNMLSPSQLIGDARNAYRVANGTGTYDDFVNGHFFGNNGVVWSDQWAKEHPIVTMLANGVTDALTGATVTDHFHPIYATKSALAGQVINSEIGINLPGVLEKYVPKALRPRDLTLDEINEVDKIVRMQYTPNKLDDVFYNPGTDSYVYRKYPKQNVNFLSASEYTAKNGRNSSGVNHGNGNIDIKKPSMIMPWDRNQWIKRAKGDVAHELGHGYQVKALDYNGLSNKTDPFIKRQPLTVSGNGMEYKSSNKNYLSKKGEEWPIKYNKDDWYSSPNEFLSEYNNVVQRGFINSDGSLSDSGKVILSNRFGVKNKDVDRMLKIAIDNSEIAPLVSPINYGSIPTFYDYIAPKATRLLFAGVPIVTLGMGADAIIQNANKQNEQRIKKLDEYKKRNKIK